MAFLLIRTYKAKNVFKVVLTALRQHCKLTDPHRRNFIVFNSSSGFKCGLLAYKYNILYTIGMPPTKDFVSRLLFF